MAVKEGRQVLIGTPGRIGHLLEMDTFDTRAVGMVMVDAADELLARGPKQLIVNMIRILPTAAQVRRDIIARSHSLQKVFLASSMVCDLYDVQRHLLTNALHVNVKATTDVLANVRQFYVLVVDDVSCATGTYTHVSFQDAKVSIIDHLYPLLDDTRIIIYCNTRHMVDYLAKRLGFLASKNKSTSAAVFTLVRWQLQCACRYIFLQHADMQQSARQQVITEFDDTAKRGRVLIATDLLSRGIELRCVPLVVNFDAPPHREYYAPR
jgi:superfamily II DNA/RNA helicase